ncbi:MAG: S1 RNA-binding domain-containing protein [Planctomycetaceae bacterium]|nr:S1 RNA-binding domain-containing protein [Planctomycetales bacterium]MCB9874241.1 S1 RNA-binding domain-containing protein [Planctomycetaceae bacterium]MCB9940777.1 S1 RNA-binding domain-containing protein [Planctomycetaceae bacterium]
MTSDSPANPSDSQPASDAANTPSGATEQAAPEQTSAPQAVPEAAAAEVPQQEAPAAPVDAITRPAPDPHKNPLRPKIHVGSRRSKSPGNVNSSKPQVARKDQPVADEVAQAAAAAADSLSKPIVESLPIEVVAPTRADIPKPSRRDPLTADMEVELLEAMAAVSLDTVIDGDATERASKPLELETRVNAPVMRVEGDNVFFGLGGRNEGFTSVRNFKEAPAVGTLLDVVLKRYIAEDGLYEVVVPGASIDVGDWSDLAEGAVVEARVSAVNTGGLECMVNNIRGFMPASQVAMFRVEDFSDYLGQKLQCIVTEVNERKRNLVLSHRALLEREREESRRKILAEIAQGDIRDGVVSNVKDFGCFVDLGGVDGMIHISQLSWERIKHPSEVVEVGQKVRVRVEKVNPDTGKISLSYRDLLDHPWDGIEAKLPLGTIVKGPVTRIAKFGAFVRVAPGVEGLIHISELAHHRIRSVGDVLKEGQEIEVKILTIDSEAQRVALSLKATQAAPEAAKAEEEAEEPLRELVVAKRKGPLKGGMDRPSGGESVGLNW